LTSEVCNGLAIQELTPGIESAQEKIYNDDESHGTESALNTYQSGSKGMTFLSNPRIIAVSSGKGGLAGQIVLPISPSINITSSTFIKDVGYEHSTCSADELHAAPPSFSLLS
jgi:hypothetical protein